MAHTDPILGLATVAGIAEPHQRTVDGILRAVRQGVFTAAEADMLIDRIQERAIAASELLATQLQTALTSRVRLEQAKGVLAQLTGLPMDQAFQLMRDYARGRGRRLSDVAAQIIEGVLDDETLRKGRHTRPNPPGQD